MRSGSNAGIPSISSALNTVIFNRKTRVGEFSLLNPFESFHKEALVSGSLWKSLVQSARSWRIRALQSGRLLQIQWFFDAIQLMADKMSARCRW
jgi:hypothetical protein